MSSALKSIFSRGQFLCPFQSRDSKGRFFPGARNCTVEQRSIPQSNFRNYYPHLTFTTLPVHSTTPTVQKKRGKSFEGADFVTRLETSLVCFQNHTGNSLREQDGSWRGMGLAFNGRNRAYTSWLVSRTSRTKWRSSASFVWFHKSASFISVLSPN